LFDVSAEPKPEAAMTGVSKFFVAALLLTGYTHAAAQPVAGRVKVNGMQMYYEVSGAGGPLVVLHGAYMNIPSMGAFIPKLAQTHKVYAVELQGSGRTTDINRPITYQNLANDVAGFMDAVSLKKADVFGYSMGAIAGLQLAIRHPQKVNRLVAASVAYDANGWQPEFKAVIPQLKVETILGMPFAAEYRKLAPNPDGFRVLAEKLIALGAVGIPRTLFSATFAASRVAGWCAHIHEQRLVGGADPSRIAIRRGRAPRWRPMLNGTDRPHLLLYRR
jgi:pimeloyl-ACP methyl ester carboxylesterase